MKVKKIISIYACAAVLIGGVQTLIAANSQLANGRSNTLKQAQHLINIEAQLIEEKLKKLKNTGVNTIKLSMVFDNTYKNSIDYATDYLSDNPPRTFMYTGGFGCAGPGGDNKPFQSEWIRDGSAALHLYMSIFTDQRLKTADPDYAIDIKSLQHIINGFIINTAVYYYQHPFEHSFNNDPDNPVNDQIKGFELDSPSYLVWLAYSYWQASSDTTPFKQIIPKINIKNPIFYLALKKIVKTYHHLQRYDVNGYPINYTGLIWTQARPSDDYALLPFNISDNFFAIVALKQLSEMARVLYKDQALARKADILAKQISHGIKNYGIYHHNQFGDVYAYEVDGKGQQHFISDGRTKHYLLNFAVFSHDSTHHNQYQDTIFKQNPARSLEVRVNGKILSPSRYVVATQQCDKSSGSDYCVYHDGMHDYLLFENVPSNGAIIKIRGNFLLMDDANLPSLLSLKYFGIPAKFNTDYYNHVYQDTRQFILSTNNPFYYLTEDKSFSGIGSPHTEDFDRLHAYIWPLALVAPQRSP